MASHDGFPIVLTADRTLMAAYRVLLDGMMAASQTTKTPRIIRERLLAPRAAHPGERALVAPLGLRRIEAALLAGGFAASDVVVVDDAHLPEAIGPATKVIGVSSGEPTGLGMSSSTMVGVVGGDIYPLAAFRELMAKVRALRTAQAPQARVIVGGPGAWQLDQDPTARGDSGIDHVVIGYAEGNAATVFGDLAAGREVPGTIQGVPVAGEAIPAIRGASTMSVVETSRGCGLGCQFCTIATTPMVHLPIETILADCTTNIASGNTSVALLSEDILRYGSRGIRCEPARVLDLLRQVRGLAGLRVTQVDHTNISSVAQFSDDELSQVRDYLVGGGRRHPWVNLGVETASGELLQANGGGAKLGGVAPEDWGDHSAEQVRRLCRAGFEPMVSIVVGLPGESDADVRRCLEWVRALRDQPVTVFPVLYAPIHGQAPPDGLKLRRVHWQLIREAYEFNFPGVARIFWGDQTEAGVPLGKRVLLQMLGKGQVAQWRWLFAKHYRKAAG